MYRDKKTNDIIFIYCVNQIVVDSILKQCDTVDYVDNLILLRSHRVNFFQFSHFVYIEHWRDFAVKIVFLMLIHVVVADLNYLILMIVFSHFVTGKYLLSTAFMYMRVCY